jgi:signal transduction histidine kinase
VIFRRALLRLTLVHSAVVLGVVALFGAGVLVFVAVAFDLDPPGASDVIGSADAAGAGERGDAAEQAMTALLQGLAVSFVVLLVLVPALSHLLARRALAPVRASYDAQQRFVDDASHEFRTPLSVLRGELELALLAERSGGEYREAIGGSLEIVDRMIGMTGDLLLLARGTGHQLDAASEVVAAAVVVGRGVAAAGRPHPGSAGVLIEGVGPALVRGVPELLVRAVANLVDNAIAFTPPGGEVRIRARADARTVTIEVRDTGIGMSPEQIRRARDRFWRADTGAPARGHGIGLSLVHEIVEAHHGRLHLRAVVGAGTVATIELPRVEAGRRPGPSSSSRHDHLRNVPGTDEHDRRPFPGKKERPCRRRPDGPSPPAPPSPS